MRAVPFIIFLVIAGLAGAVFWTVWRQSTKVEVYDALACRFEAFCSAGDCTAVAPPDFGITPKGKFNRPYLSMTARPSQLSGLFGEGQITYFNGDNDRGNVTIVLKDDLTFSYQYEPVATSGEIRDTGTGACTVTTTAELPPK